LNAIAILRRFIKEQASFDSKKNIWKAKANKDIEADSARLRQAGSNQPTTKM